MLEGSWSGDSVPLRLDSMKHRDISVIPGSYQVYRNIKDFGAKGELFKLTQTLGDDVTDDTDSIKYVGNACSKGFRLSTPKWICS
jgi:hypothetical protein